VPTLWIYAENDTYFPPALSRRLADAFAAAGGKADYVLLPPVGGEGHAAIRSNAWERPLVTFLAALPEAPGKN
jgi:pimeloyl-ACP methyl ester carboxylesterase